MQHATTDDGVKLAYVETGHGTPVVFVHEFAGDVRSWEPQLRHFGRRYRCVAFNARGYPPSDVPESPENYSQARAADDIAAVMDEVGLPTAHIVGLSMGGFATLHFGFRHPQRARSLTIAGCGYGADKATHDEFVAECDATVAFIRAHGMAAFAERYAVGPSRVQFQTRDMRGFADFIRMLGEHSALGSVNTQLGVQRRRPSLYDLTDRMAALHMPALILTGDEDWPCLLPGLLMKRHIPTAALAVMPNCGHAVNQEDPDTFNRIVGDFLAQVDAARWPTRDPRAMTGSATGMR
jgi:pimeloyl-ACP methyl ester carboxylesterase